MKALWRSGRLARLGGCAALVTGLAGTAVTGLAGVSQVSAGGEFSLAIHPALPVILPPQP